MTMTNLNRVMIFFRNNILTVCISYLVPFYILIGSQYTDTMLFWPLGLALGSMLLVILMYLGKILDIKFVESQKTDKALASFEKRSIEIHNLTDDQVISIVDEMARINSSYDVKETTQPQEGRTKDLPPLVALFFSKYESFRMEEAGYTISETFINNDVEGKYTVIGLYRFDERQIAVKGTEESVYILDGIEKTGADMEPIARSIFHFIVLEHRDLQTP